MRDLNILLLSAGRRVELIECFRKAAGRLNVNSEIIAADCQDLAPALYVSDRCTNLVHVSDPSYISNLVSLVTEYKVALIVPTIDTELRSLAAHKEFIEERTGARLMLSRGELVEIFNDKLLTHRYLQSHGFGVPFLYGPDDPSSVIQFPVIVKPRTGSSSKGVLKCNNAGELECALNRTTEPMVQEFVDGPEYTVDCFSDFNGKPISCVPRLRITTRGGEISKGRVEKDDLIISDVLRFLHIARPIGQVTIQCLRTNDTVQYLEVNPRFGGGAPMSIRSGADSCERLYRLLRGETLEYSDNFRSGLTFLRFDHSVCLDENLDVVESDWT